MKLSANDMAYLKTLKRRNEVQAAYAREEFLEEKYRLLQQAAERKQRDIWPEQRKLEELITAYKCGEDIVLLKLQGDQEDGDAS